MTAAGRARSRQPRVARGAPCACAAVQLLAVAVVERKYDSMTGSSTRFVRMMAATPMLAATAISWMTWIWMKRIVKNPMVSVASAMPPGTSSLRKLVRAADRLSAPSKISEPVELTICTPWLTAIAKTRKGTRIDMGSMPKPSSVMMPSCHTTATRAHEQDQHHQRAATASRAKTSKPVITKRDQEEDDDALRPFGDVANHLREPDDVDVDRRTLDEDVDDPGSVGARIELLPHAGLDIAGDGDEVEALAGVRVELHQLGAHNRAREVVGHQPAHDAGLEDVAPHPIQPFGR